MKPFVVIIYLFVLSAGSTSEATVFRNRCLPGYNHKKAPGPEGPEYKACHVFKENTCCTANFTNQLAVPVVENIDSFNWTLCGILTKPCQDFMVGVECFYRCSPNVAHWEDKKNPQAFINAPVCSHYCDAWFDACRDDMTCAKNWLKDFELKNWANSCKNTSKCQTFKKVYNDGRGLCESMWGDSFKYTSPNDGPCLHFNFSGKPNPNDYVVVKIFGGAARSMQSLHVLVLIILAVTSVVFACH